LCIQLSSVAAILCNQLVSVTAILCNQLSSFAAIAQQFIPEQHLALVPSVTLSTNYNRSILAKDEMLS
jgi:hypothetical protein